MFYLSYDIPANGLKDRPARLDPPESGNRWKGLDYDIPISQQNQF